MALLLTKALASAKPKPSLEKSTSYIVGFRPSSGISADEPLFSSIE